MEDRRESLSGGDSAVKIVAIGGGTGLSTMLRGLKNYTKNLTAIVTVADDGGGSGVLRRQFGMPPPGDLRNCMEALSNVEPIMQQLLSYRFSQSELSGQSFGNLLLAALNGISDSFEEAVMKMSQVLAITGQVLPVTSNDVQLEAVFENGARIVGESGIGAYKKKQDCRILHVNLIPSRPVPTRGALRAIEQADLILLGPGSLYTSIIPNLLVPGIPQTVARSSALKIYVCNVMTQEGETEGYTASEHVEAILTHGLPGMLDLCLANSEAIPGRLLAGYRKEGAEPLILDRARIEQMGLGVREYPLASQGGNYARHDPEKLAQAIFDLYRCSGRTTTEKWADCHRGE